MLKTAAVAFTTFFATIGPIEAAAMFAAMTAGSSVAHRRSMAIRGCLIASGIMLAFALFGELLLAALGISLAALRTAGGILLLLIGIDMVFARASGGRSTTDDETEEGAQKEDISVFPLATGGHHRVSAACSADDLCGAAGRKLHTKDTGRHRLARHQSDIRRAAVGVGRAVHFRRHSSQRTIGVTENDGCSACSYACVDDGGKGRKTCAHRVLARFAVRLICTAL
jgi:hypothetical protein